eukprot:6492545-Amphidinium_carterae.2
MTGQYGLGRNSGVEYLHLMVTQIMAWSKHTRQRLAWWFIDVRTAFDRIIRQLMTEPGSSLTLSTLQRMGLTTTAAKNILRTVQEDRPILWEQGLSEALVRLLSSCLKNTWLVLPEDQGDVQISTGLGTPQGSSLSGLLFILPAAYSWPYQPVPA